MNKNDASFPVYPLSMVGLSAERPMGVCTISEEYDVERLERAGDFRDVPLTRDMRYLRVFRRGDVPGYTEMHRHEFYEIALVRRGAMTHKTQDGDYELGRGDVIVMTPRAVHGYARNARVVYSNIYLHPIWLLDELRVLWGAGRLVRFLLSTAFLDLASAPSMIRLETSPEEADAWERELIDMESESERGMPNIIAFNGALLKILAILDRAFGRMAHPEYLPITDRMWQAAGQIERALDSHAALDLTAVGTSVGLSRDGLCRAFRKETGWTPMAYFQYRRMMRAQALLHEGSRSITAIAHDLGFADSAHFTRTFRRFTGMAPGAFRKECS